MRRVISSLFLLRAALTTISVIAVGISVLLVGLAHAGEGSPHNGQEWTRVSAGSTPLGGHGSGPDHAHHSASTKDRAAMPDPKSQAAIQTGQLDSAKYFAECMRDWDAATHMTRQEWTRTCRRVVDNREKFMREQRAGKRGN